MICRPALKSASMKRSWLMKLYDPGAVSMLCQAKASLAHPTPASLALAAYVAWRVGSVNPATWLEPNLLETTTCAGADATPPWTNAPPTNRVVHFMHVPPGKG